MNGQVSLCPQFKAIIILFKNMLGMPTHEIIIIIFIKSEQQMAAASIHSLRSLKLQSQTDRR